LKRGVGLFFNNKVVHYVARFVLGGVFIYASIDKIAFPREFVNIVVNYHILPARLSIYFGYVLPWIELIFGIFLVTGLFIRESSLLLSSLLAIFMIAVLIKSLTGTLENCGCFSMAIGNSRNILYLFARDFFLLFLGVGIFIRNSHKACRFVAADFHPRENYHEIEY